MQADEKPPTLDRIQKLQVADWLKRADKLIRIGRYTAADELLQKVFEIDPDNSTAASYEERIQFLVKQLSQRVGISVEAQIEIRSYTDRMREREVNRLNSYLLKAHKFLEEGFYKKAEFFVSKALSIDRDSVFANALAARLNELKDLEDQKFIATENELKYSSVLKEYWKQKVLSPQQQDILNSLQKQLQISDERRATLELLVKRNLYKEHIQKIWLTGGLASFTSLKLDDIRKEFEIPISELSAIEAEFLKEVRKNKIKATVCVIDEDESDLIEIVEQLRALMYAVVAASNIQEGISTIRKFHPNIVLSEVALGGGYAGLELFELIRSKISTADIPFIFIGKHFDRTIQVIGKRLGVDEFILKPIDYEMLSAIIDGKVRQKLHKMSKKSQ